MLLIDSNEDRNQPNLIALLRQSIEDVEIASINQTAGSSSVYPDFVIMGGSQMVGINRKQTGEVLSNIDKVVEQLQREIAGPCEHIALLVEGIMQPTNQNSMYGYSLEWAGEKLWGNGDRGTVPFSRRHYQVNPKHIQNELTRLEFLGVQVIFTTGIPDTASKLIAFHDLTIRGEPNNVLNRLRKADITVHGLTFEETAMARTLMSMAGIGEELALTIAASFSTIGELMRYWMDNGTIADLMLRSGTRRVGTSAENKLKSALGYTSLISTGQSAETSNLSHA